MFEEVIANEPMRRTLARMLSGGRLPHAVLFQGELGSGRKTMAKLLAKAILCKDGTGCGACPGCRKMEDGNHPDFIPLGMDCTRRSSFHIEEIRALRAGAYIAPNDGDRKVYCLYNAQNMTVEAQNALLKILEEPPAGVVFLLVCENKSSLLETIVSRCMVLTMELPSQEACAAYLHSRLPEKGEDACRDAAAACGGNIGRALELLSGHASPYQEAQGMLDALLSGDEFSFAAYLSRFERRKEEFLTVLALVKALLRNRAVGPALGAGRLSTLQCLRLLGIIEEAEALTVQNVNFSLVLALFCAQSKNSGSLENEVFVNGGSNWRPV